MLFEVKVCILFPETIWGYLSGGEDIYLMSENAKPTSEVTYSSWNIVPQ